MFRLSLFASLHVTQVFTYPDAHVLHLYEHGAHKPDTSVASLLHKHEFDRSRYAASVPLQTKQVLALVQVSQSVAHCTCKCENSQKC